MKLLSLRDLSSPQYFHIAVLAARMIQLIKMPA